MKKKDIYFPDNYVVIDVETTGLQSTDKIIELAALKVKNGEIVDSYQQLVNPGMEIPKSVQKITGITNGMVANAPDICEVAEAFRSFVGTSTVVGHNVNFDVGFVNRCLGEIAEAIQSDYVDTLKISRDLMPRMSHHRLCDVAEELGISQPVAHRALADCETTHYCLQALKSYKPVELSSLFDLSDAECSTLELQKELGLTPKTFDEPKPLYYRRPLGGTQILPCKFIGLVSEQPTVVKISVEDREIDIALDFLKEMQPTQKEIERYVINV
ncbi:MAG: 3'-5' exonuclease [Clostridia bacterium]|nr:3'-5' exonuclease [Clostridia bacterium]